MISADQTFRRLLVFLTVVAAVLLGVVAVSLRNVGHATDAAEWVNHTHATRAEVAGILASLHAAEAALRTYLLTGDARDQADYRAAFSDLAEHVDVAKALTRQVPAQYRQILQLEDLLARRADLARETIRLRQADSAIKLRELLAADAGGETVRDISRLVARFLHEQAEVLAERDHVSYLQAQTTRWTVVAGLVLDLLLLAGAAWLIRDDLRMRQRAGEAMREANDVLEARVLARTTELTAANAALKAQNLEDRWARLALEHQQHYDQLIIDSMSELAVVVTQSLNISRINAAVGHLTGRPAAELVDRPLARLVRLAAEDPAGDPLARALRTGRELRDLAAVVTDHAGRSHPRLLNLTPLRDAGKVVGGVVTLRPHPPAHA